MAKIKRDLPNNEYQAAVGANSPSVSNVFATIADIVASGGIQHAVASGTNTYTVTIPGVIAYTDGDAYLVRFTNGNDADSTININSLGVKTLTKKANVQVTGGDIVAGQEMLIIYDGTNFQCIQTTANQLFAYVTNDDSVTITAGQPVYAFGAAGNRMSVKLANNTGDATSAQTVGLVFSSSIAPNQRGFVITQGVIDGLNTGAYNPGDQLYLGATAGSLTDVKPYAPNHLVYIGIVEIANAGNGQIYVKPQNGYELDELHDVDLITNTPTDGQVLTYDNGSGLWKNEDLPAVIGESINANLQPVLDNTISDPSTIIDPNVDDAYLVPVGAIGVWAGQDNNIATWDGEQWIYYVPSALDITTVLTGINAGNVYEFDGVSWVQITSTSPGATPFYLAGSGVDAGGNKTSTIARVGPVTLGSNSGAYGLSRLTVRGTGSLENVVTRWGMGSGSVTGINNWFRIAGFNVNYGTSKNYQILVNIGAKNANTFASVVLHINISKSSPGASTGKAICRVVNVSGPGYLSTFGDGDYRLDESNFEFRRYANASLGTVNFRLYYKPTIADSFMSVTVLNAAGGTTSAIGIQWFNSFLGAAIEAPGPGGSTDNYATFNYSGQRTNISAIIDPTVTDDYTLQYTVGSLWYNTVTQKVFQCLNSASGAAVWKQTTNEATPWNPNAMQLDSWLPGTTPATLLANGNGAGYQYFFSSITNQSIIASVTLDNSGLVYDGSDLVLRIGWQLFSTIPGSGTDVVRWRVTYVFISLGEDADSKVTTVANNNVNVLGRNPNQLYQDDLLTIPGVPGAKLLSLKLERQGSMGADTYPNTADLFTVELIKN